MRPKPLRIIWIVVLFLCGCPFSPTVLAQGTQADYERANGLKAKYESAAIDIAGPATWIGNTHRFWYRKLSRGAYEYIIFDADTLQKKTAFDHTKIAAALAKLGSNQKASDLQLGALRFDNEAKTFFAAVDGTAVRCVIADSTCSKDDTTNRARSQGPFTSPDGKWEDSINNYNVLIRATHAQDAGATINVSREPVLFSTDGSEGNYYEPRSLVWSPDSTR